MTRLPNVTPTKGRGRIVRAGFVDHHHKGSHRFLWHPARQLMVTVPVHPGDLSRVLLKKIIKQAGLNEDQFRKLL